MKKFYSLSILFIPLILFGQRNDFPYELKKNDFITIGVGVSTKVYANFREKNQSSMTYNELISLDRNHINWFDRGATNYWNKDLHKTSNWTRNLLLVAPTVILLNEGLKKEWKNFFTYGVMYFEVALLTMGVTDLTKTLAMRRRPYFYNTNISLKEREKMITDKNVFDSFFSGHTAISFATAVFLSKTYTDIYGNNTMSTIIWGVNLAVAATTGYLRYKSGYHYPTDILAGALVGSAIGYLIPVLHKQSSKINNISFRLNSNSISLTYVF